MALPSATSLYTSNQQSNLRTTPPIESRSIVVAHLIAQLALEITLIFRSQEASLLTKLIRPEDKEAARFNLLAAIDRVRGSVFHECLERKITELPQKLDRLRSLPTALKIAQAESNDLSKALDLAQAGCVAEAIFFFKRQLTHENFRGNILEIIDAILKNLGAENGFYVLYTADDWSCDPYGAPEYIFRRTFELNLPVNDLAIFVRIARFAAKVDSECRQQKVLSKIGLRLPNLPLDEFKRQVTLLKEALNEDPHCSLFSLKALLAAGSIEQILYVGEVLQDPEWVKKAVKEMYPTFKKKALRQIPLAAWEQIAAQFELYPWTKGYILGIYAALIQTRYNISPNNEEFNAGYREARAVFRLDPYVKADEQHSKDFFMSNG
jgi:hypothetical protein